MKYLLWTAVLLFFLPFAPDGIDYGHKSIQKTLRKVTGTERFRMKPLEMPGLHEKAIKGKYFEVSVGPDNKKRFYLYVGRVNSCRAGGCSSSSGEPIENPEYEYFDYFILFDTVGTVRLVRVFNYEATHGQEITSRGWLKQFTGYSGPETLEVGKNIDAISGATVSVYAITLDVQDKTKRLQKVLKP